MQQLSNEPGTATVVVEELLTLAIALRLACERLRKFLKKYTYEADVNPQVLEVHSPRWYQ